jgi:hypothetical protein
VGLDRRDGRGLTTEHDEWGGVVRAAALPLS